MKRTKLFILFSFLFLTTIQSQSTERFIRIIGNSNHVFESNLSRVYFTVNEVAPNEYKKISYKTIESAHAEFVEKMQQIGFQENEIIQTNGKLSKFNKTKTKYYYIDVSDQEKLDGLSGLQNPAYSISEVKYLYTNLDPNTESKLSLEAIKDAKRKAKKLCDELDMKLGKVLNIEDRSSGCCTVIEESKRSETAKKYNITITFELLD